MRTELNPAAPTRRDLASHAAALLAAPWLQGMQQRWNVLWLVSEDTSPDLGCYGDAYAHTPTFDRLASQGARFTRAFTIAGVCAPSRSGIITGMYPTSIGTLHMRSQGVPPPQVRCFPEYLRAAGYYCTNNAKTDYNFAPPVTAWDESSGKAHWRSRPGHGRADAMPFFAVFNAEVSHESRVWDENHEKQVLPLVPPPARHDPGRAVLPPYYPDTPKVRRAWANYYDGVTAADTFLGRILAQLEEDGLANSTVVFYYGDHGRGLPRAKRWVYDSGTRIPLIVRWPGMVQPGSVVDDIVSGIDLGPTVLSIANVPVPKHMQGQPFLGPQKARARDYAFSARDRMDETYDVIRGVRDRRFRYVRNDKPGRPYAQYIDYMEKGQIMQELRRLNKEGTLTGPQRLFFRPEKPAEELYDTRADPHEINDLATDPRYRADLLRLRAAFQRWRKETNDLGVLPEDELKERMRPGGQWSTTGPVRIVPEPPRNGQSVVTLACPTEGASIAWTADAGERPWWRLYAGPITLRQSTRLRARACRLGYHDGPEAAADITV